MVHFSQNAPQMTPGTRDLANDPQPTDDKASYNDNRTHPASTSAKMLADAVRHAVAGETGDILYAGGRGLKLRLRGGQVARTFRAACVGKRKRFAIGGADVPPDDGLLGVTDSFPFRS